MKHRPLVTGATLLAVGAWLWHAPPSLPTEREVLRVGEWAATVSGQRRLPAWIAPYVLGLGSGVVVVTLVRRR